MKAEFAYIQTLEEYAKFKKIKALENMESLSCEDCRYCRENVNACIFGNQVRNLDYMTSCPRVNKFLQIKTHFE